MFDWFFELLYMVPATLCKLIDVIISIFRSLCGLAPINIGAEGAAPEEDILMYFLESEIVMTIFWIVLGIGVLFLFIVTIVSLLRSFIAEEKTTPQMIAKKFGKSLAVMAIVPMMLFFGIFSVNKIVLAVDRATGGGGEYSLGGRIITIGLDVNNPDNWEGNEYKDGETGLQARKDYIEKLQNGSIDYSDTAQIKKAYKIDKINFVLPLLGGGICLVSFAMTAFIFIRRLWDILTLFILLPIMAGTIPIDDGARFKLWRDMTISKVLGSYGILIVTNIFLSFSSLVFGITIPGQNDFTNAVVQLLFVCGGSLAISGGNVLVANLIGSNAGQMESQQGTQMFRQIVAGAVLAKQGVRNARTAFRGTTSLARNMYGGGKTAIGAAKTVGVGAVAGASYVGALTTGRGGATHDRMMEVLQGKNYAGSIDGRLATARGDKEYRASQGISKGEHRSKKRMYTKMFKATEHKEAGGLIGKLQSGRATRGNKKGKPK